MNEYVICKLCDNRFGQITEKHTIKCAGITIKAYQHKFPMAEIRTKSHSQKIRDLNTIWKSGDNSPMKNPIHLEKMKINQKRVVSSKEHRDKLSKSHLDPNSYFQKLMKSKEYSELMTGQKRSNKTRRRMRIAAINHLKKTCRTGFAPNYNTSSISIIEEYGAEHGYNFQHAENGGEHHIKDLGYWVDGYDKGKNVVIEYYEKSHEKQKERDHRRQKEIIKYLGCKFIIIRA